MDVRGKGVRMGENEGRIMAMFYSFLGELNIYM